MHLIDRPQVIVASKMDEEGAEERLKKFEKQVGKKVIPISCITDEGLDKVLYACYDLLKTAQTYPVFEEKDKEKVYDATSEEPIFTITKTDDHTFVISGTRVERTYDIINISTDEGMMRLITYLNKIGVDKQLHQMGAKDGDTVKLKDFSFDFYE